MVSSHQVHLFDKVVFLGIYPVIDHGSMDVHQHGEYLVKWALHGLMLSIDHLVPLELIPKLISVAMLSIKDYGGYAPHSTVIW